MTPLLLAYWAKRAAAGKEPSDIAKMEAGCLLAVAAYALLAMAAFTAGDDHRAAWLWIVGYFVLLTLGELCVSPIALSLFYRIAPARLMMLGVWFLSGALGNYLTGLAGSFWEIMPKPYFWLLMAAIATGAGVTLSALKRSLERLVRSR